MIHSQKEKDMEEFEKKFFVEINVWGSKEMYKVLSPYANPKSINDFISQIYITICENEIKRLTGECFVNTAEAGQFALHSDGWNNALEEQIDYWQDELTKLTK